MSCDLIYDYCRTYLYGMYNTNIDDNIGSNASDLCNFLIITANNAAYTYIFVMYKE